MKVIRAEKRSITTQAGVSVLEPVAVEKPLEFHELQERARIEQAHDRNAVLPDDQIERFRRRFGKKA